MAKTRYISARNLPPRLPLFPSLTMYLFLERIDAPGWVWGATGLLFAVVWIAAIWAVGAGEAVDVLKDKP